MQMLGLQTYRQRDERLKNNIRERRKQNRWTLAQLGEMTGISLKTVWRMERMHGGRIDDAYKVAAAFQVTVYELYSIRPIANIPIATGAEVYSVRELRLKRNLSLQDLAAASGVARSTIFAIEKGTIPSVDKAVKIAAALKVSVYQIWKP